MGNTLTGDQSSSDPSKSCTPHSHTLLFQYRQKSGTKRHSLITRGHFNMSVKDYSWMDGWMDGWTDRQIEGRTDRQKDG